MRPVLVSRTLSARIKLSLCSAWHTPSIFLLEPASGETNCACCTKDRKLESTLQCAIISSCCERITQLSSYFVSRTRRHTRSVSAFLLNRSSDLKKSGMVNITSSVNSRERSGINTILHELNPLFTINVTMRDIKSKNVYSRVNSKATTQWRKTESANGVHLEGVASDNRSS